MQASRQHKNSSMSSRLNYHPMQEVEAFCLPQFQTLDHHLEYNDGSKGSHFAIPNSYGQYCTLEVSSANVGYAVYNSPSTVTFSPSGSPMSRQECQSYAHDLQHSSDNAYGSLMSGLCITNDANDLRHKLNELESVMLGPDSDTIDGIDSTFQNGINKGSPEIEMDNARQIIEAISRRDLKQVLITCAKAVSDNELLMADWLRGELHQMVSVSGEPIQRLGAYMLEGLVARLASSGSSICNNLRCKKLASTDVLSYMHILYEVCPYVKFGYMSANGAIAEAMKDENRVHIIDFQIGQGSQWITLIQAFAARPGGPPHIRITGIDNSMPASAHGGLLNIVGKRLSNLAKQFKVPFLFHAVDMSGYDIQLEKLGVQPGEAVAVNFAFVLHHVPDESVSTGNYRDQLLMLVKRLSPKVVTLVEQEFNTNTVAFYPRFLEVLNYYTAMFESIDVTLPREHKERINVEQHCLARDVVNIIACEGPERVERHELLSKWRSRFTMAGFKPCPLSSVVNATIKTLLESYCDRYRLEERDGALFLGWMNRDLVASCAWR